MLVYRGPSFFSQRSGNLPTGAGYPMLSHDSGISSGKFCINDLHKGSTENMVFPSAGRGNQWIKLKHTSTIFSTWHRLNHVKKKPHVPWLKLILLMVEQNMLFICFSWQCENISSWAHLQKAKPPSGGALRELCWWPLFVRSWMDPS